MAEIRAFRGLRYDLSKVGALADVIAPPYDVIDADLERRLLEASPHNIIRVELAKADASGAGSADRYAKAAVALRDWRRSGVLFEEPHPAIYVYHQEFDAEGQRHVRKGFLARVRLARFGEGSIYPHEETLSGPKANRIALYRATGSQVSPVFGMYEDPTGGVLDVVEAGISDRTPREAVDHLGVTHRLWMVTDSAVHTAAQGLLGGRSIYIADGHHRYETALRYRDELEAAEGPLDANDPAQFVLMMLVGMSDPGLVILPTHRLVSGLAGLDAIQLCERLDAEFDVEMAGSPGAAWERIEAEGEQSVLGFGTASDGRWLVARLRSDATMDRLVAQRSPEWRALGVAILHELVLRHLLGDLGTTSCRYVHSIAEVNEAFSARSCDLACLVHAAGLEHVVSIAGGGETMPPKSTYFYPKLATGLVLNPIRLAR
jgi:uncharacterized protein (DUF1015 family)